jgi:SAM-dependent methyltransferase
MKDKIITKAIKIYDESYSKYGNCSQTVLWGDQQSQYLRFKEIMNFISFERETSILDVGCGICDFYKFLNFNGFTGKYTGYDINENLLLQSKKNYPAINLKNINILEDKSLETYDFVVVSGLFNNNYGQDFNWIKDMLRALFELGNKKIIFNAISSYVNFKDNETYYINPLDILDFIIKELSPHVTLVHGKLPFNFTVCIDKSDSWKSINAR